MFAGRLALTLLTLLLALLVSPALARAGSLTVSAQASVVRDSLGGSGHSLFFSLDVPLDRVARSRASFVADDAAPREPPPRLKRPRPPLLSHELVRRTVRQALIAGGRTEARRRLQGLASRARTSAALPEVALRGDRTVDETLRLTPTLDDPYRYTQAGGVRLSVGARLSWRLDRAVFASEELMVERLRGQRDAADARRIERVLRALFAWHRAVQVADSPDAGDDERAEAELVALEQGFTLDVLTGGWFGEHVSAPSRRRR